MPILPYPLILDEWEPLSSQEHFDDFIDVFGGFADTIFLGHQCWGDCYIDDELNIVYPPDGFCAGQKAIAAFQRQASGVNSVEMLFIGLSCISIGCRGVEDDGVINSASLVFEGGEISFKAAGSLALEDGFFYFAKSKYVYWRKR